MSATMSGPVYGIGRPNWVREPVSVPPDLAALWQLQEPSGTTVNDSLGAYTASTTGTVTLGQTGPSGLIPYSALFGGGYVSTGAVETSVTGLTIACWFKTTSTAWTFMLGGRNSTTSLSLGIGPSPAGYGGAGKVRLFFDGGGLDNGVSTSNTYHDGNWHHVAGVFRGVSGAAGDAGQMRLFIDGQAVAQVSGPYGAGPTAPFTNSAAMQIGANGTAGSVFAGNLAMLGVWKRALTSGDVRYLYSLENGSAR